MKSIMHQTDWILIDGHTIRTRFKYGYSYITGNKEPYVSITQDSKFSDGGWCFGAANMDMVSAWEPELAPLCKWHLSGIDSGPMHYIANAKYWWEVVHGRDRLYSWYSEGSSSKSPLEAREILVKHIVYGALDEDFLMDPVQMPLEDFLEWLERRRGALVQKLRSECDPIVMCD